MRFIDAYPTPTNDEMAYMKTVMRAMMRPAASHCIAMCGTTVSSYDRYGIVPMLVDVLPHAGERTAHDWVFWTEAA